MKSVIIAVLVLGGLAGLFLLVPGENSDNPGSSSVAGAQTTSSFASIEDNLKNGSLLLDVRTPEEFEAGHIEGAINMPLSEIQSGTLPKTGKEVELYVYCRSGNRSAQAKTILNQAGYQNVEDLGAMEDVVSLGGKQVQ
jgi:phage shock protein E